MCTCITSIVTSQFPSPQFLHLLNIFNISSAIYDLLLTCISQFSRYITTSSTTTATSQPGSELEPPSAPPPPPPPLNIPPSRARRQLAARLALHKQNTGSNSENASSDDLDKQERSERRENLNPFATDEDDDDDTGDDQDEFTIGDLEAEEEGRGILPPGSPMAGKAIPVRALDNVSFTEIVPKLKSHNPELTFIRAQMKTATQTTASATHWATMKVEVLEKKEDPAQPKHYEEQA